MEDYHTWSHKPGSTPVTDIDESGNVIYDPEAADKNKTKNGGRITYLNVGYLCDPDRE